MCSNFLAPETWGAALKDAVQSEELAVIPYDLHLDYNYWSYRMYRPAHRLLLLSWQHWLTLAPEDVITSILPEELHDGMPTSFNTAGHVGKSSGHGCPLQKMPDTLQHI